MTAGLYTIVCDYAGGTFVSQVQAEDQHEAVAKWAAGLNDVRAIGGAAEHIATAAACVSEDEIVAIDRLTGVWCWTVEIGKSLVLANIIRSAD